MVEEVKGEVGGYREHSDLDVLEVWKRSFRVPGDVIRFENCLQGLSRHCLLLDGKPYVGGNWLWVELLGVDPDTVLMRPECTYGRFTPELQCGWTFDYDRQQRPLFVGLVLSLKVYEGLVYFFHESGDDESLVFYRDRFYGLMGMAGDLLGFSEQESRDFFYLTD